MSTVNKISQERIDSVLHMVDRLLDASFIPQTMTFEECYRTVYHALFDHRNAKTLYETVKTHIQERYTERLYSQQAAKSLDDVFMYLYRTGTIKPEQKFSRILHVK